MVQHTRKAYSEKFKEEAVKQVLGGEERVSDVAKSIDLSAEVFSGWIQEYKKIGTDSFVGSGRQTELEVENNCLRGENLRLLEERNILKKSGQILHARPQMKFEFI